MNESSGLDATKHTYYEQYARRVAEDMVPLLSYGERGTVMGKKARFYKLANKPVVTTPLVEGVTPVGSQSTISYVEGDLIQLGDFEIKTDLWDLIADDSFMQAQSESMGEQGGRSINYHVFQELASSTNIYRVNSRAADNLVASTDYLTLADCKKITALMRRNSARGFGNMGHFVTFIHPDVEQDLTNDTNWKGHKDFQTNPDFQGAHIGTSYSHEFVVTNEMPIAVGAGVGGTVDVYTSITLAAGAFGVLDLQAWRMILKALGSEGSGDPLDQRGSVGWKTAFIAQLIFDQFVTVIKSASSY